MEEAKENHPDTQPIWEADVEAEKEMEMEQLNSKRKLPSKSCCIIFGILALVFCILILGFLCFGTYHFAGHKPG